MPSQTANLKLPYPLGSDPVANGDDQIKALAERVEARMAWGWLGYVERTAPGTVTASGTTLVTMGAVTLAANRRYRLAAFAPVSYTFGATMSEVRMADDTNAIIGRAYVNGPVGGTAGGFLYAARVFTPGAGARTYRLDGFGSGGINWTLNAETTNPCWLMLEDIGPATIT